MAGRLVLFAKERGNLDEVTVALPSAGSLQGLALDLEPNTTYYYAVTAGTLELSTTDMGGSQAPPTPEQGADTPVWLATLPDGGPHGGFFRERQPTPW